MKRNIQGNIIAVSMANLRAKIMSVFFVFINIMLSIVPIAAQQPDSAYIRSYPQIIWATGYVSTNTLQVENDNNTFSPNYPINAGIGLGIRNTMVNFLLGHSIVPLKGDKYGKTKAVDLQVHSYGRHHLIDLYYQKYRGFFSEDENTLRLYPGLSVQQIGMEDTYIFNGNQFSAKAAFEQSEKQVLSAGSFLLGGGAYWHRMVPDSTQELLDAEPFNNVQLGINTGYAYSWVIDQHWFVTGMATAGANFGNETELAKKGRLKLYPTVMARASSVYHKDDWSIAFSMLIHNKAVYAPVNDLFTLTSLNMQLSFVKQLNYIFKKQE
ncbi:DUF4421 family protein [Olivibacter sitiensis]|uniref:DUF4421 family protein n=1 Tax=Olivibacter sitiensis TaxID=376470 RepID=UPI0006870A5E|nr:DUF4421 family protein [Olivibacter sitiensis]